MKIISLTQGTPEWDAHRAAHLNASEVAAMLNISPYKTREQLLREKATGITPEVDAATQRRFDDGHRFEALARPFAEEIIGVLEGTKLSASFDGLTMDESIVWEHKTLNSTLDKIEDADDLPEHYRAQLEQQLLVSGADKALFMASSWDDNDNPIERRFWFYGSDPALRQRIIDGWAQFEKDLSAYVLPDVQPVIVADPVQALPAVSVQVTGSLTIAENFTAFEQALRQFLDERLIREPQTDQDFADLGEQIKALKRAEDALDAAEAQMLAQVSSIDAAKRAKEALHKLTRDNRLMAEKLLEGEKRRRREEKVIAARQAFAAHLAGLQHEIPELRLNVPVPDFAAAIKGLKTLESMQDKLNAALANGKIAADQQAADLRTKLAWVNANASEHRALLADLQQLTIKPLDDFKLAITARIDAHQKAEAARLEAERARIRAEEAARLERERLQAEQARAREENAARRAQEHEAEKQRLSAHADQAIPDANVQRIVDAAPQGQTNAQPIPKQPGGQLIKLGDINAAIAPLSITADGLAQLGFAHIATERAAKLYRKSDLYAIFCEMSNLINVQAQRVRPQYQRAA